MQTVRLLWIDLCIGSSPSELFSRLPTGYVGTRVSDFEQVDAAVRQHRPAFACVEFDYPDRTRLQMVPLLRRAFPTLPVVMFTEYHSEALAVWAFRSGVWDYRVKPVDVLTVKRSFEALTAAVEPMHQYHERGTSLPPDLIEPAGHLQRPPFTARKTGMAVAYIVAHFDEPLKRDALARLCHLSPSEFSREFRREQGTTFIRFLLEYRIAKARELLAEQDWTISQVAYAVGFNDSSYFSRAFRRLVGASALGYQRAVCATPAA